MPESNHEFGRDIELLDRQGFFVIEEFLDAEATASLIASIGSLEMDTLASRVRRGAVFARRNLLQLNFVRELLRSARVREIVSAISPSLTPVRAILFDKNGEANWTVPWHQDRSIAVRERIDVPGFGPWSEKAGVVHVQPPLETLQQMVSLRFHLDQCSAENGPLRVIADTHHCILHQDEVARAHEQREQRICTTGAGGLVVMRPLILHASSAAAFPEHRRVIHVEFGPPTLPAGLEWAGK